MKFMATLICCLVLQRAVGQDKFTVNGQLPSTLNGKWLHLTFRDDEADKTDSVQIQNGQFTFSRKVSDPMSGLLYLHTHPFSVPVSARDTIDFLRFYMEPVSMTMQTTEGLKDIKIEGSTLNDEYVVLQRMLKTSDDASLQLRKEREVMTASQKKDEGIMDAFISRERKLEQESDPIRLAFAEKYPNSYLSALQIWVASFRNENAERVLKAYEGLGAHLKENAKAKAAQLHAEATFKTKIGQMAPDFEQDTPEGKSIKLSDLRGKYVLVDFWASWCGPCRAENPNVIKAYEAYKRKGFDVLGVSLDNKAQQAAWVKAIAKDGLPWTNVSDLKGWDNAVAQLYGVRAIPTNFLIDPNGKIIARELRGEALSDKLKEVFGGK